jgi:hypothetical protein
MAALALFQRVKLASLSKDSRPSFAFFHGMLPARIRFCRMLFTRNP